MTSGENLRVMEGMIVMATQGNDTAKEFLRDVLSGIAKNCPEDLLISLTSKVAEYRRDEMQNEATRN